MNVGRLGVDQRDFTAFGKPASIVACSVDKKDRFRRGMYPCFLLKATTNGGVTFDRFENGQTVVSLGRIMSLLGIIFKVLCVMGKAFKMANSQSFMKRQHGGYHPRYCLAVVSVVLWAGFFALRGKSGLLLSLDARRCSGRICQA